MGMLLHTRLISLKPYFLDATASLSLSVCLLSHKHMSIQAVCQFSLFLPFSLSLLSACPLFSIRYLYTGPLAFLGLLSLSLSWLMVPHFRRFSFCSCLVSLFLVFVSFPLSLWMVCFAPCVFFRVFFFIQIEGLRIEGVICCTDCKTPWVTFLTCDIGLNKIVLTWHGMM